MKPVVTTLDNGLRVVTDRMDSVESVSLGIWVGAGTRYEAAEVNGIAHLLEHMAFKGTARRSAAAIAEEIEAVGGHLNAYTGREVTAYYAKVLKDDVPLALDILADILQHSLFEEAELVRERAVVLQEIGQVLDTPDDIVFDRFQAMAYPQQPLGWPVLGEPETVTRLSRRALVDYLNGHYGGPTMVLAASGCLEHQAVVDLAARAFRTLPRVRLDAPVPGRYGGGDHREDRPLEQLHLVVGFDGIGFHDAAFHAVSVLSTLLGGGMSSRLFQEIRERRGLAYAVYTFTNFYADSGLIGVYAGTGDRDVEELVPVLCDEIARVAADVSDAEVDRARAQLKANLLMGLESTTARAEHLGQHMLVYGRPVPVEETVADLNKVDAAAVRCLAERLFRQPPTVAAIGPTRHLQSYDGIVRRLT